jgi:periplasmic copper chaperone A
LRQFLISLGVALALAGCGEKPVERVTDARITLPAAPGRPGAAYFTLHGGERPNLLLEISTPKAIRSELHDTINTDGKMSMSAVEGGVDVPAGDEVVFAPGGLHAMLFDLAPSVKAGDKVPLKLSYGDGKVIEVQADVRAPGDADSGEAHKH